MKSKTLDQFYTKKEVAKYCYEEICKILDIKNYKIIEPSAGTGSFSDLFHDNFIALDLDPKKEYIKKQDFFDFNFENEKKEKIITIGNPPFGKNSSLAIKFFNKSSEYSDYICMILPRTFKKDSVVNKLNLNFHLFKEIKLNKKSFIFNEKEYDVPCVFQIWKKSDIKRNKINQKIKSDYFEFVSKENADFAIRRVGGLAGKVIIDFEKYKEPSHYYLRVNDNICKLELIEKLKKIYNKLNEKAKDTAGNPSLSKFELISILESEYK